MSANHTSGPFEAVSNLVRTARKEDGSGGFLVAECVLQHPGARELARLFAAAPDLLDVVERLLREDADGEYTIGLIEDARAAIAKATEEGA